MKFDHKIIRFASIGVGLIIALVGIYMGFQLFSGKFTRAADNAPRDVVVSKISQNDAQVSWATGNDTQGVIEYGTSPTALNFFAPESSSGKNHQMDLTLLSPATAYYFQIRIGDKKYDNGGVPWTFTTKSSNTTSQTSTPTDVPTSTPSAAVTTPKPISTIVIPNKPTDTPAPVCSDTDCVKICQKLGIGCSTQDFIKNSCIGKVNMKTCEKI